MQGDSGGKVIILVGDSMVILIQRVHKKMCLILNG